jgi:membrane protein insertase Oxa1/YidC/SpoIIIJ
MTLGNREPKFEAPNVHLYFIFNNIYTIILDIYILKSMEPEESDEGRDVRSALVRRAVGAPPN